MIRVGDILQSLGWRDKTSQLRKLDLLTPADRARVEAAIAALPANAAIDIDRLVETLRRQAQERAAAAPQADPLDYFLTIATPSQLLTLRRELERGSSVDEAMERAQTAREPCELVRGRKFEPSPEEEPLDDDDLDDEAFEDDLDDPPRPRRRLRLLRRKISDPQPEPEPLAVTPKLFGSGADGRPYGCPVDADYQKWKRPSRPPWLDDDAEEETARC